MRWIFSVEADNSRWFQVSKCNLEKLNFALSIFTSRISSVRVVEMCLRGSKVIPEKVVLVP